MAHCLLPWGTAYCPQAHSPSLALVTLPSSPQAHTDSLNTLVALHQLYQYTQKYYDQVGGSFPGQQHLGSPLPSLWSDTTHP